MLSALYRKCERRDCTAQCRGVPRLPFSRTRPRRETMLSQDAFKRCRLGSHLLTGLACSSLRGMCFVDPLDRDVDWSKFEIFTNDVLQIHPLLTRLKPSVIRVGNAVTWTDSLSLSSLSRRRPYDLAPRRIHIIVVQVNPHHLWALLACFGAERAIHPRFACYQSHRY